MYDCISCEVPLPDGCQVFDSFQTKDLSNTLSSYKITRSGRLVEIRKIYEDVLESERRTKPSDSAPFTEHLEYWNTLREQIGEIEVDCNHDGPLVFYMNNLTSGSPDGYTTDGDKPYCDREYRAEFQNGDLQRIVLVETELDNPITGPHISSTESHRLFKLRMEEKARLQDACKHPFSSKDTVITKGKKTGRICHECGKHLI